MIEIKKYKAKHLFKTYWNTHAGSDQFDWLEADCTCVYFFGFLLYKHIEVPKI